MGDVLLAWRNVWRNPRRSLLTMLAIAFASGLLVFMLSFQFGTYEDMINASVKLSTGDMQIQAKGYHDKHRIRMTVNNPAKLADFLKKDSAVKAFSERDEAYVISQSADRTRGVMLMGIDPAAEKNVSGMDGRVIKGKYLDAAGPDSVMVGDLLAERLKLKLGSEVTLLGQGRDGSVAAAVLKVAGIFRTGFESYDRDVMMTGRKNFDSLFYMDGSVHRIVVMTDSLKSISGLMQRLQASGLMSGLVSLSWDQLQPGLKQSIEVDLISGFIMYIILIIVVAFSILNTFIMAVFERTREFGVLLSLGTTPGRLVRVVMTESFFIALLGLVLGIAAGAAVTLYYSGAGISMEGMDMMQQFGISGKLYPSLSLLSVSIGPALVAVVTFFAALYPALRIAGLKPAQAMRAV